MDLKAYAAASGKKYANVIDKAQAWEVLNSWDVTTDLPTDWMHYRYIHAAPQWLWGALVESLVAEFESHFASNPLLPGDGRGIECLQSQSQALARHVDSLRLRQDAPPLQCTKVQSSEGFLFISC